MNDEGRQGSSDPGKPGHGPAETIRHAEFGLVARLRERGLSDPGSLRAAHRLTRAHAALRSQGPGVGDPVAAFQVPGRIEVAGKHVDYAGGTSLVAAVERGISVMVAVIQEPKLVFVDADGILRGEPGAVFEAMLGPGGPILEEAEERGPVAGAAWHLYPRTALRRIARDAPGRMDGGAVVAFSSSLPQAAGLSSSTALLTAFWMALDARFGLGMALGGVGPFDVRRALGPFSEAEPGRDLALARYLSALESGRRYDAPQAAGEVDGAGPPLGLPLRGVGTDGGSQDHAAVLLARAGRLTRLRFRPMALIGEVTFPPAWVMAVGVSGVHSEKAGGTQAAYNRLASEARDAAARWRDRTGRDEPHLGSILESLSDEDPGAWGDGDPATWMGARFLQFRTECQEVLPSIVKALESWSHAGPERMGRALDRSQRLAEEVLQNQVPETVFLVRSARRLGVPAASAFGAGFGGAVWAMVRKDEAAAFLRRWRHDYLSRFPSRARGSRFFFTPPGPGAFRVF